MEVSSLSAAGGATQSCSTTSDELSMALSPAPIWLGASGNTGHEFANSYISEVLYFQSALTSEQVASVQAYLIEKWGLVLQSNLALPPFPPSPPPFPPPLAPETTVLSGFGQSLAMWLDASDSTTLFQDVSGMALVSAPGQSVSLWKDKSGKGNSVAVAAGYGSAPTYNPYLMGNLHPGLDFTQTAGLISTTNYSKSLDITLFLVATIKAPTSYGVLWGHFPTWTENGNSPNDADICLRQSGTSPIFNWHTNHDDLGCAFPYTVGVPYMFAATLERGTSR